MNFRALGFEMSATEVSESSDSLFVFTSF